jgi:transcriptional regulator with XRE-family HTH domain
MALADPRCPQDGSRRVRSGENDTRRGAVCREGTEEAMTTAKERLAERLKRAASESGVTSAEIAGRLGGTDSAVRAWWTGRNAPSPSLREAYAEAVGKPLAFFLGEWTEELAEAEKARARQAMDEVRRILGTRVGRPWSATSPQQKAGALAWLVQALAGGEEEAGEGEPGDIELLGRVMAELGHVIAQRSQRKTGRAHAR